MAGVRQLEVPFDKPGKEALRKERKEREREEERKNKKKKELSQPGVY